jgi:serine/threonine protein phosphatase PrpC
MNELVCVASSALTHTGQARPHNEDFVQFFEPNDAVELEHSGRLYIVADGVGGAQAGERASRYACEQVMYEYYYHPEVEPPGDRLSRAIRKAGNEIYEYAERRNMRMASTIVAVVIRGTQLIVAHVGDSRCYLLRNGKAHQITTDHTEVEQLVKEGIISREDAEHATGKNRLSRSVGGETDVIVDVNTGWSLHPGDKVLLCSDGLTRYASLKDLESMTQNGQPEEITKRLIDYANDQGGSDNISVIMVMIKEIETMEVATNRPARGVPPSQSKLEASEPSDGVKIILPAATSEVSTEAASIDDLPTSVPLSVPMSTPAMPEDLDTRPTVRPKATQTPASTLPKRKRASQSFPLIIGGIVLFLVSICIGMLVYFWLTRSSANTPPADTDVPTLGENQSTTDIAVAGTSAVETSAASTLQALSATLEAENAKSGSSATETAVAILQQQNMEATLQQQHATETVVALTPTVTLPPPVIALGSKVKIVAPRGVNLRDQPSTGQIIYVALTNEVYSVTNGPEQAGGLTWWYLDNGTYKGWAAEVALDGTKMLEATSEP